MKNKILKFMLFLIIFGAFLSFSPVLGKSEGSFSHKPLEASKIIFLINQERAKRNLPLLSENFLLSQAALAKNIDMLNNGYFDHVSPLGKRWEDFIRSAGYSYSKGGENLARGFEDENELVEAFMASAPHRQNILNKDFEEIGISVIGEQNFLTIYFGTPARPKEKISQRSFWLSFKETLFSSIFLLIFKNH